METSSLGRRPRSESPKSPTLRSRASPAGGRRSTLLRISLRKGRQFGKRWFDRRSVCVMLVFHGTIGFGGSRERRQTTFERHIEVLTGSLPRSASRFPVFVHPWIAFGQVCALMSVAWFRVDERRLVPSSAVFWLYIRVCRMKKVMMRERMRLNQESARLAKSGTRSQL